MPDVQKRFLSARCLIVIEVGKFMLAATLLCPSAYLVPASVYHVHVHTLLRRVYVDHIMLPKKINQKCSTIKMLPALTELTSPC